MAVIVGVSVGVRVDVGVGPAVVVKVGVWVSVGVHVRVGVGVPVRVGVHVAVGVIVCVRVCVGVGGGSGIAATFIDVEETLTHPTLVYPIPVFNQVSPGVANVIDLSSIAGYHILFLYCKANDFFETFNRIVFPSDARKNSPPLRENRLPCVAAINPSGIDSGNCPIIVSAILVVFIKINIKDINRLGAFR